MSDEDGIELDPDELADLGADNVDDLKPEDVFKMTMVNKPRKKRVIVEIEDADKATVKVEDVVQELLTYIKTKMKEGDENQFMGQILPLMSQAVVSGLGRMLGIRMTAFYLSDETSRYAFIQMMCVAFLMLKFVQQKGLTINTYETDVSDEEIEELDRKGHANDAAMLGALAGKDPRAVLEELRKQGKITDSDLRDMLGDKDGEVKKSGAGNN
jgi:hypothetical protein